MFGIQNILQKSMNAITVISDGVATIENGNIKCIKLLATDISSTNLTSTNIYGSIKTPNQNLITSLGTLSSLAVSGNSSFQDITCKDINQISNYVFYQTGYSYIDQMNASAVNFLSSIIMNHNANFSQSGSSVISQSGSGINSLKRSNITGQLSQSGDIVQSSGSNTFLDCTIGNITQLLNKIISQSGTGTNILKATQITDLIVTTSMQFPSSVTLPDTTYNGNSVYINSGVIQQSGTGVNTLKSCEINGDLAISGNFNMTGGSALCTLKSPTIQGDISLSGNFLQSSGVFNIRGLTCNAISINADYDILLSGIGKISQSGTGTNTLSSITMLSNKDIIFNGLGKIDQSNSTGSNIFQSTTFNDLIKFNNSMTNSRKIILYDSNSTTQFNHYGFSINSSDLRYNVGTTVNSHIFSSSNNATATNYNEMMRINNTGLGIGVTPSYKLHVVGSTKLDGINIFTTSLNNISPSTFNYLSNVSSDIQSQINNIGTSGSNNASSITLLQNKTFDLSYNASISTFANSLSCKAFNSTTANHTGLLTCQNGLTVSTGTTNLLGLNATTITCSNGLNINSGSSSVLQGLVRIQGNSTFPSTSTGGIIGLGIFSNKSGGNGETNLLSYGGGGSRGYYEFYGSSNTNAPLKLATLDATGSLNLLKNINAVDGVFTGSLSTLGHTSTFLDTGNITSSGVLSVALNSNLTGNVICQNYLNVYKNITSTGLKTHTNTITSSFNANTTNNLVHTINVSENYCNSITVVTPISIYVQCNSSINTIQFYFSTSSYTYTVKKNGIIFTSGNCSNINNVSFQVFANNTSSQGSANMYIGSAKVIFTPTYDIVPATYTIEINVASTSNGTVQRIVYFNSTQNQSPTLINANSLGGLHGVPLQSGYIESLQGGLVLSGEIEVNDIVINNDILILGNTLANTISSNNITSPLGTINNITSTNITSNNIISPLGTITNLTSTNITSNIATLNNITNVDISSSGISSLNLIRSPIISGAQLITQTAIYVNIYVSVTNYTNFYPNTGATITVGSYNASISYNDYDRSYMIMPGYRLQVYDNVNYTGTLILDVYNITSIPVNVQPTSLFVGSSCKLYFNQILL